MICVGTAALLSFLSVLVAVTITWSSSLIAIESCENNEVPILSSVIISPILFIITWWCKFHRYNQIFITRLSGYIDENFFYTKMTGYGNEIRNGYDQNHLLQNKF